MARPEYPDREGYNGRTPEERLDSIEQALWGPVRKPNGLVGDVHDIKRLLQQLILGLLLAGAGAVVARVVG